MIVADWINKSREYLLAGMRPRIDQLQVACGLNDTQITLNQGTTGSEIVQGSWVSVDLEIMLVLEMQSNSVATVLRGQRGSSAATHAVSAVCWIDSDFPDYVIFQALQEECKALSASDTGLFAVQTMDITYNPVISGYDLSMFNSDILEIHEVSYKQATPDQYNPLIRNYRLDRTMTDPNFPSSLALFIYESAWPGLPIHVVAKIPFGVPSTSADDVNQLLQFSTYQSDIPPMGAAIRLVGSREIQRNLLTSQDNPRTSEQVPPGAVAKSAAALQQLYVARIQSEAARLIQQYPPRSNRRF